MVLIEYFSKQKSRDKRCKSAGNPKKSKKRRRKNMNGIIWIINLSIAKEDHYPGDIISLSINPEQMEKMPQNSKYWMSPERDLTNIDEVASNSDMPLKPDEEITNVSIPIKKVNFRINLNCTYRLIIKAVMSK